MLLLTKRLKVSNLMPKNLCASRTDKKNSDESFVNAIAFAGVLRCFHRNSQGWQGGLRSVGAMHVSCDRKKMCILAM